ncbi:MAG: RagB/SusD family nutrient uptake outer membrane protein [Bacteroidales bacterium]|nr:RagB/SusD family nutrient uptake outer membrane protein [Bacteroidales bacterium]
MKNIIRIVLVSALIFVACDEEEYLDKKPHTPSDYAFYTTEGGAIQGLNAVYDVLQLGQSLMQHDFIGSVCSGDALAGGEPGGNDQPPMQELMKFTPIVTNNYCFNQWYVTYRGIYRCNLLLSYLSKSIDGFDDALRNRIRGEALFLRGLFHFRLQIKYGGFPQLQATFENQLKGVPFIDRILLQDEWNQVRPELNYTWERIEEDFIEAASLLEPRSIMYAAPENVGRATKGAALAMLAKTYLFQEKWQLAYETAKEVINSNEYYLEGEDGHNDPYIITRLTKEGEVQVQVPGYKWIWQAEANNCAESIFDVQHFQDHTTIWPEGMEGNIIPRYYGPRAVMIYQYNRDIGKDTLMATEYFWGFILPTKYFVSTAYRDIGCTDGDGNILDPRFKLTVVTPEDSVPYYYADPEMRAKYPDSVKVAGYYNNPATGNITWKYYTDPYFNEIRTTLGDMPQTYKIFRFADLLLIGAEAAVWVGQQADALNWINRVRNRARNAGNTGYPLPLTAVTKEDVWAERRVELAFENHQYWDIIRTGRAQKVIKEDAMQYQTTTNEFNGVVTTVTEQFGDNFVIGKSELWPIPQAEIDGTNGSITQNPGYY